MQARRYQYLKAMGIQVWQHRDHCAAADLDAPEHADAHVPVVAAQLPATQQAESVSEQFADVEISAQNSAQELASSDTDTPEFRFASVIFPDTCLIVAQVPVQIAEPLGAAHLSYLENILFALGHTVLASPKVTLFNWPMLRSSSFDQSMGAAVEASQAFLRAQRARHPVPLVLLMGETAGRYLWPQQVDAIADSGCFYRDGETTVLLTDSIERVFSEPQCKARVWAHFQTLQGQPLS